MTGELTDVQRAAAEIATGVFARLGAQVDEPDSARPPLDDGPWSAPRARTGIAAAVNLFAEVVLRMVDGVADLVEQDGDAAADGSAIALHGAAGTAVSTSVWLHNLTASPVTRVGLRLTRLTAHDGSEIVGSPVVFDPAELDVAADASGQALLTLTVPPTAAPGVYHGHVLASGVRDAALPVRLVVQR